MADCQQPQTVVLVPLDKKFPFLSIKPTDLPAGYWTHGPEAFSKTLYEMRINSTEWSITHRFPSGHTLKSHGEVGDIAAETEASWCVVAAILCACMYVLASLSSVVLVFLYIGLARHARPRLP